MSDIVGVTAVSDDLSPDSSNGIQTPSADSVNKVDDNIPNNDDDDDDDDVGGVINDNYSDDSWSVIYSSDDSNSINDVESKLTESGSEDNNRDLININEVAHEQRGHAANHSIATIVNAAFNNNKDDGTASITTLRRDSGEPWNGSLSIPKLSIKDSNASDTHVQNIEDKIEVKVDDDEDTTIDKEEESKENNMRYKALFRNLERSGSHFYDYLKNQVQQISDSVSKARRESIYLSKIPSLDLTRPANALLLVLAVGIAVSTLSGNMKESIPDVGFLETYSANYNALNPPKTNYLMCEGHKSFSLIERNPATDLIDKVYFYGANAEEGERHMKNLEEMEIYTSLARSHSNADADFVKQRSIKMGKFFSQYCEDDNISKIYAIGHELGVVMYASTGENGLSEDAKIFASYLPDVPLKVIEKYSQSKKFIVLEPKGIFGAFASHLKDFQKSLVESSQQLAVKSLKWKDSIKCQGYLPLQTFENTMKYFQSASQSVPSIWNKVINKISKIDGSNYMKLRQDVGEKAAKGLQIGLIGAAKLNNVVHKSAIQAKDEYFKLVPVLKNFKDQAKRESIHLSLLAQDFVHATVKPSVVTGYNNVQEKTIIIGSKMKIFVEKTVKPSVVTGVDIVQQKTIICGSKLKEISNAAVVQSHKNVVQLKDIYMREIIPMLKLYKSEAQKNSANAVVSVGVFLKQTVKPITINGFNNLQKMTIVCGSKVKNSIYVAGAGSQEVLIWGKAISNDIYMQLRHCLGIKD